MKINASSSDSNHSMDFESDIMLPTRNEKTPFNFLFYFMLLSQVLFLCWNGDRICYYRYILSMVT